MRALGASIFALCPQTVEHSRAMLEKRDLGFEILHDSGNEVAAAFGLRFRLPDDLAELYGQFGIDLPASNGDDSQTLPLPARYVVDGSGVIRSAYVDPDYTRRPEPADTLEALRSL